MAHYIDQDLCTGCGKCPPVCPIGAITGSKSYFEIDIQICNDCIGLAEEPLCVDECPITGAIKELPNY